MVSKTEYINNSELIEVEKCYNIMGWRYAGKNKKND